ncbi:MAG: helix-turn-helix transcriptional regulator [Bacteroidia bacterium]|nr:helix-turn-helix transcriptional regulator [Bacteroidia bacterium]
MPQNKTTQYKNIGNAIKLIRVSKGFTQEYMANKLGYSDRGAYAKIERGENVTLDILLLIEICDMLGCNLVHLMLVAEINIFKSPIISYTQFKKLLERYE